MVGYRQPIRPGQSGGDVLAVKRAYRAMHVPGCGTLVVDRHAGVAFVAVTRTVQRMHRLAADGVYGPATHAVVAPHFDAYGAMLYRTATIRKPPVPPVPSGDAQAVAKRLLALMPSGRYTPVNPGDLRDLQATADGRPVWSQGGYFVHLDARPLKAVEWLIEQGFKIGTYSLCSDHGYDGPHGHSGGFCVDVEEINGYHVADGRAACRTYTLAVAKALHGAPGILHPRQLICGGYGNHRDADISACCIPAADSYYGSQTMAQHTNHLHYGV